MKYEVKHPSNKAVIVETETPLQELIKKANEEHAVQLNAIIDGEEKTIGYEYLKNSEIKEIN